MYRRFVSWLNNDNNEIESKFEEKSLNAGELSLEESNIQVVNEMKRASQAKAPRTGKVSKVLEKISSRVSNRIGIDQF